MNKKISCNDCNNFDCFIKKHCTPECLAKIGLNRIQIEHQAKDTIFREGGYVGGMYFIQHGQVKIVANGGDNREQIVRMATDGQIFGHRGLGDDKYPVSAVALSDTVVCFIDNTTLYEAYMVNPKLTYEVLEYYSLELQKAEIRMKYLAQMNVREKITEALLFIREVFGLNPVDGTLNVNLSRQEIADMTGAMVEQVSRELGELQKENLIAKSGRSGIKLTNIYGLQELVKKYGIEQYASQLN
jgi:CRP-like cAMP-binding protein